LVASPVTAMLSSETPLPTTPGPTEIPMPIGSSIVAARSRSASAASRASTQWSVLVPETLKVAITASPANLSTIPCRRSTRARR
jgi:hypothetical protein